MSQTSITITGNTGADVELTYTPSGRAKAKVTVAVNARHHNGTEWVDGATSWHTVIAWGDLAANLAESAPKGSAVVVTGRLEQRSWESEDKEKRSTWEITADDIGLSLRRGPARSQRITRTSEPSTD